MEFESLLKLMVHKNGSDLFITAGVAPSLKVNGKIAPVTQATLTPIQAKEIVLGIMTPAQKEEFEKNNECNFAISASGIGRFRVSAFMQRNNAGMVLRKIETTIPTMSDLNLPDVFKDIAMTKRGLVLMVGATGSGKSTSLAAMEDWRNTNQAGHIITNEEPGEFMHPHKKCFVTQREVGSDTVSFQAALKNTLRQAPDVILLGEIRERDTMEHAIAFAETGHLAMATLHANNSNQALERIINFFPEEQHQQVYMNLAMNLRAILSQRLVKTASGGRVAAIEVLINTPRIADLVLKGDVSAIKEAMESGEQHGMHTFDQALFKLWQDGQIAEIEALRNADSANNLSLKMKMKNIDNSKDGEGSSGVDDILQNRSDDDGIELSI